MSRFDDNASVLDSLNRAIRGARHLRVRDAALVAAAREVARRIDAGLATDNVSAGTFLKYLAALQLQPPAADVVPAGHGGVAPKRDELAEMRERMSG